MDRSSTSIIPRAPLRRARERVAPESPCTHFAGAASPCGIFQT